MSKQIKYGESRGEGHKSGERFRYDPADKKAFQALNQVQKDSLHGEAMKYNKPFFSPKHGVNVDPEDGVLSNRPVYSDDTKLTYDKIDKPHSESSSPLNFFGPAGAASAVASSIKSGKLSDKRLERLMKKYAGRSDNWLRKKLKSYENKLSSLENNPMYKKHGGGTGMLGSAFGLTHKGFQSKIDQFKALLEKRSGMRSNAPTGVDLTNDFTNEWGSQGTGGLAGKGEGDFGEARIDQLGTTTGGVSLAGFSPTGVESDVFGGRSQIISQGDPADAPNPFNPGTTDAMNQMMGTPQPGSFDNIMPPVADPDQIGMNSLYAGMSGGI